MNDLLNEISSRKSGKTKVSSDRYPLVQFTYQNYEDDPKPLALILGKWKFENGNQIIGGVNLNYLNKSQIGRLKQVVKAVFKRDSLRARYRFLKEKVPDIAAHYRTYDPEYIENVRELNFSVETDKEQPRSIPDKEREAQALRTRMAEKPTMAKDQKSAVKKAEKERTNRNQALRRQARELEKEVDKERVNRKLDQILAEPDDLEPVDSSEEPSLDLTRATEPEPIRDVPEPEEDEAEKKKKSDDPNEYIAKHLTTDDIFRPDALLVENLHTGQILADNKSFAKIVISANWIPQDCVIRRAPLCESRSTQLDLIIPLELQDQVDKFQLREWLKAAIRRPWGDELPFRAVRWSFRLDKIRSSYGEKIFVFSVIPRYSQAEVDGKYTYRTPANAVELDPRPGHIYRGMSWEEWRDINRKGKIESRGDHNLSGQEGLTFWGNAETAEYYANGFAPVPFKPTITRPGIIIEIPEHYAESHEDRPNVIPNGEYATTALPLQVITRRWKLIPHRIKPGRLEIVVDHKKATEGSRIDPSVTHSIIRF